MNRLRLTPLFGFLACDRPADDTFGSRREGVTDFDGEIHYETFFGIAPLLDDIAKPPGSASARFVRSRAIDAVERPSPIAITVIDHEEENDNFAIDSWTFARTPSLSLSPLGNLDAVTPGDSLFLSGRVDGTWIGTESSFSFTAPEQQWLGPHAFVWDATQAEDADGGK